MWFSSTSNWIHYSSIRNRLIHPGTEAQTHIRISVACIASSPSAWEWHECHVSKQFYVFVMSNNCPKWMVDTFQCHANAQLVTTKANNNLDYHCRPWNIVMNISIFIGANRNILAPSFIHIYLSDKSYLEWSDDKEMSGVQTKDIASDGQLKLFTTFTLSEPNRAQ